MQIQAKESLYVAVGQHVASHNAPVELAKLEKAFDHVELKKLKKALQNACSRNLIHTISQGVYRGGPRPAGTARVRLIRMNDEGGSDLDTEQIVRISLSNRHPLDSAWCSFQRQAVRDHVTS